MRFLLPFLLLAACDPDADDTSTPEETAGDDTAAATCDPLPSGRWVADGACFGMPMRVDLAFDADACTFTLDNWDMEMGPMPTGGALDGSAVTLVGDDAFWSTCTGVATGDTLAGVCDGGCGWELALEG